MTWPSSSPSDSLEIVSSSTPTHKANFFAELFSALFTQWSWRHRMDRAHFWSAMGLILATQVISQSLLSTVGHGHLARVEGVIFVVLFLLVIKCDIWRYRDAGFSPLWLILQMALMAAGFFATVLAGIFILVSAFGAPDRSQHLWPILLVGIPLMLATAVWMFVWCIMPTKARNID